MIKRNLYRRLEQLEACAPAAPVPEFVVVNAGTPGGVTCVWGPDGRLVWLEPPEGSQAGQPIEDHLTRFVERRPRQTGRGPFASPSGTRHNRAGCEGITE